MLWHKRLGHPRFNYLKFSCIQNCLSIKISLPSIVKTVLLQNSPGNIILSTLIKIQNQFTSFIVTYGVVPEFLTLLEQDGLLPLLMITQEYVGPIL